MAASASGHNHNHSQLFDTSGAAASRRALLYDVERHKLEALPLTRLFRFLAERPHWLTDGSGSSSQRDTSSELPTSPTAPISGGAAPADSKRNSFVAGLHAKHDQRSRSISGQGGGGGAGSDSMRMKDLVRSLVVAQPEGGRHVSKRQRDIDRARLSSVLADRHDELIIPDTIVWEASIPRGWFFTSLVEGGDGGGGRATVQRRNVDIAAIESQWTAGLAPHAVAACFYTIAERDPAASVADKDTPLLQFQFLRACELSRFLHVQATQTSGSDCAAILQQFAPPLHAHNVIIQAVWSPRVLNITVRQNINALQDDRLDANSRACTFEGSPHLSQELRPTTRLYGQVEGAVHSLTKHFAAVDLKHRIVRLVAYFKVDRRSQLNLLYVPSIRVLRTALIERPIGVRSSPFFSAFRVALDVAVEYEPMLTTINFAQEMDTHKKDDQDDGGSGSAGNGAGAGGGGGKGGSSSSGASLAVPHSQEPARIRKSKSDPHRSGGGSNPFEGSRLLADALNLSLQELNMDLASQNQFMAQAAHRRTTVFGGGSPSSSPSSSPLKNNINNNHNSRLKARRNSPGSPSSTDATPMTRNEMIESIFAGSIMAGEDVRDGAGSGAGSYSPRHRERGGGGGGGSGDYYYQRMSQQQRDENLEEERHRQTLQYQLDHSPVIESQRMDLIEVVLQVIQVSPSVKKAAHAVTRAYRHAATPGARDALRWAANEAGLLCIDDGYGHLHFEAGPELIEEERHALTATGKDPDEFDSETAHNNTDTNNNNNNNIIITSHNVSSARSGKTNTSSGAPQLGLAGAALSRNTQPPFSTPPSSSCASPQEAGFHVFRSNSADLLGGMHVESEDSLCMSFKIVRPGAASPAADDDEPTTSPRSRAALNLRSKVRTVMGSGAMRKAGAAHVPCWKDAGNIIKTAVADFVYELSTASEAGVAAVLSGGGASATSSVPKSTRYPVCISDLPGVSMEAASVCTAVLATCVENAKRLQAANTAALSINNASKSSSSFSPPGLSSHQLQHQQVHIDPSCIAPVVGKLWPEVRIRDAVAIVVAAACGLLYIPPPPGSSSAATSTIRTTTTTARLDSSLLLSATSTMPPLQQSSAPSANEIQVIVAAQVVAAAAAGTSPQQQRPPLSPSHSSHSSQCMLRVQVKNASQMNIQCIFRKAVGDVLLALRANPLVLEEPPHLKKQIESPLLLVRGGAAAAAGAAATSPSSEHPIAAGSTAASAVTSPNMTASSPPPSVVAKVSSLFAAKTVAAAGGTPSLAAKSSTATAASASADRQHHHHSHQQHDATSSHSSSSAQLLQHQSQPRPPSLVSSSSAAPVVVGASANHVQGSLKNTVSDFDSSSDSD